MKTLYLECKCGASGDMVAAALYDACGRDYELLSEMQSAAPEGVKIYAKDCLRKDVSGTLFTVECESHGHVHRSLSDVNAIIDSFLFPAAVKARAKAVYKRIASAEARVHGSTESEVRFHEVGGIKAVTNVVCSCFLLNAVAPERVICSSVNVGGGTVRCAHGTLPVPTPATAELLKGIPVYSKGDCEMCTTTGAALLAEFADSFGEMPPMVLSSTGYGMGGKDLPDVVNCLRAFTGQSDAAFEETAELVCNIDDMTGEALGYACEKLMKEGALDCSLINIQMKKNRPGVMLVCLCRLEDSEKFAGLIFKHTTTIGVRMSKVNRYRLQRETFRRETEFGEVTFKRSYGAGVNKIKPEYEDVAAIAERTGLSIAEITKRIDNTENLQH